MLYCDNLSFFVFIFIYASYFKQSDLFVRKTEHEACTLFCNTFEVFKINKVNQHKNIFEKLKLSKYCLTLPSILEKKNKTKHQFALSVIYSSS